MTKLKDNDTRLEKYLSKLEREAGDDLVLLLEYGTDCFETFELKLLLERVIKQEHQLLFLRRIMALVLLVSLFSIGVSIYAFIHDQILYGYLFLGFLPLYLGVGAYLVYRFQKANPTISKTPYLKNLLEKEIAYRGGLSLF